MNRKCYLALRRSVQPVERRFVSVDLNAMYDNKNYNNNNHINIIFYCYISLSNFFSNSFLNNLLGTHAQIIHKHRFPSGQRGET